MKMKKKRTRSFGHKSQSRFEIYTTKTRQVTQEEMFSFIPNKTPCKTNECVCVRALKYPISNDGGH